MHFNIYIDDVMGRRLADVAERLGESRNAVIRKAVDEWLERQNKPRWPTAVLDFSGIADLPPFETGREGLGKPSDDPLA